MIKEVKENVLVHQGLVERGAGDGLTLGFPTANIVFYRTDIVGTYASEVVVGEKVYQAAIYANQPRKLLEAYLFDFSGNLYGQEITMTLFQKVAETEVFIDVDALQKKIARDVEMVKKYFAH